MTRREFITLLGGAATWPLAARGEQLGGRRRLGVLMATAIDDPESRKRLFALLQGLQELGWSKIACLTQLTPFGCSRGMRLL
jgi:putative tryptophan/tyrosine transport system substrate-binding protein